jgi:hypothetical protein
MKEIAVSFVLISAALFGWVVGSEGDEIALLDFSVFGVALLAILAVQLLLLYLLNWLLSLIAPGRRDWVSLVLAAMLVAANAYYLAFVTLEAPTQIRVAYAVAVGAVYFALMSVPRLRSVVALFAGAMLLMSLAQYGYTRATLGRQDVTAETVSLPIKSKRNVYILGNESLHSPKAYRELYDINDPGYVRVLQGLGFRVFDSSYSAERSTLRTYSVIFEFVRPFRNDDVGNRSPFINDNSTFRSFRDSGYGIQFIYVNNMFDVNPKNVDYVYPDPEFDACDEAYPMLFYGLCQSTVVKRINELAFAAVKIKYKKEIEEVRRRVDFILQTGRPWLTFTHIKFPFHTQGEYQYPDAVYAASFKRRVHEAVPIVAENMKETAGYIVEKDPSAIVVVMGDHGTHLFRGIEKDEVFSKTPPEPIERILEGDHGVTFAIYPADFCKNRISPPFSTRFLIENLIACLNGQDSPTEEDVKRAHLIRFFEELQDFREILPKH